MRNGATQRLEMNLANLQQDFVGQGLSRLPKEMGKDKEDKLNVANCT